MVGSGSGALVCGSVTNGNSNMRRAVNVTARGSIVLDDLYVNDSITMGSYVSLLINKIGSMTDITI